MKLYLIASVAISVSCIYLGILGLEGKTRKPIRRLFFLMCCSMGWFLFCAGLSVTAAEKGQVILWYRISSAGFSSFYAFNLHFYISLYRKSRPKLPDLLIYIPVPFVLVGTLVSDSLFNDFVLLGGQWRFFPAYGSIWFWVYFLYYFPYTACTVPILFRRAAKSGLRRHRMQAIAISTFTAVTLIVGSSADFLLPGFEQEVCDRDVRHVEKLPEPVNDVDPLRVAVSVTLDDETLTLTVDEELTVLAEERTPT